MKLIKGEVVFGIIMVFILLMLVGAVFAFFENQCEKQGGTYISNYGHPVCVVVGEDGKPRSIY